MNYEAMSHAELVELAKLQRQHIAQQAELISALERQTELAGQVIQAKDDSVELRQQVAQVQIEELVKETANAITEAWLEWLAAIDKSTLRNRKTKAKRYVTAREKKRQARTFEAQSGRPAKDRALHDKFIELAGAVPPGLLALAKQRNMPARRFVIQTLVAAKRALGRRAADEAALANAEIQTFVMYYKRKLPHLNRLHSR